MKKLLSFLLLLISIGTMAQKPPKINPATPNQIEQQKKAADMIRKKAEKDAALANASLVKITMWLTGVEAGCRYSTNINGYFGERKFAFYAGYHGKIVDANSYEGNGSGGQEYYTFKPFKTVLYKDLVNQNLSFNMDLTKPVCDHFRFRNLSFTLEFSDQTIVHVNLLGQSSFATTYEPKGNEVHVSRYLPGNAIPEASKLQRTIFDQ